MNPEKQEHDDQELYEIEQCEHERIEDRWDEQFDELRLERQREKSERLERMEDELLDGVIGERLDRLDALLKGNPTAFIANEEDIELLAGAYVEKAVGFLCHYFFTGARNCDHAGSRLLSRFETVAKYLSEGKRQKLIDAVDERRKKIYGDKWQAFKSTLDDFWSTPANRAAIQRVSKSMPDKLPKFDISYEYYSVLQQARNRECLGEDDDQDDRQRSVAGDTVPT